MPHILQPNAAGVDNGATEIYIAVPGDSDSQPVRCFPTFTAHLKAAADWLRQCGITSVAMESTGVYLIDWISLNLSGGCNGAEEGGQKGNFAGQIH